MGSMARTAQFALYVTTAVSAADVPQLRGRQLASQSGNCDSNDVCIDHGYTGYNHKNSGGRPGDQTQVTVRGGEDENPWWLCAERCYNGPRMHCTGWTFAYDGAPHAKSYKCYLKWGPAGPVSTWSYDPNVISGLPWKGARQLASQSGNCDRHDVCIDHGYTGYNHKNSGGRPGDQTQVTVRGSEDENPWWLCAERCYNGPHKYCTGWTFAYDGAPHAKSYECYLKWGPAGPVPTWSYDPNVISGLPWKDADVPQLSVVEDVAPLSANLTSQHCSPQSAGNCNCDWMAKNGDDGRFVDKCSCACREKNPQCTAYGPPHSLCNGCVSCDARMAGNYDCSWMNNCGDDGTQWTPAATACRSKYASQCGYHYR